MYGPRAYGIARFAPGQLPTLPSEEQYAAQVCAGRQIPQRGPAVPVTAFDRVN
jgi:hypothetical protein